MFAEEFENENEIGVDPEDNLPEVEPAEDESDFETDLELDENGDVIIPEDEDDTHEETEEQGDEDEEEAVEDDDDPAKDPEPVAEPAREANEDPRDRELAALRRELSAIRSQTKDTLEKLGVKGDDVMKGLVQLAAEASDQTPEKYLKEKQDKDRAAEAIRLLQTTEFNKKAAADLREVQAAYPETKQYASIRDIPNFATFGRMRDLGLSPKQAYAAANPDGTRAAAVTSAKKQSLEGTKDHLKPAASKRTKDTAIRMPKAVLAEWRGMFPGRSDKEIAKLYKEAMT